MRTLSENFIARAKEVMRSAGMNIVAYKRQFGYGDGMQSNLIFELDHMELGLELDEIEKINEMCPPTFMDNVCNEVYFIIDCVPVYISEVSDADVAKWYAGLTKIKRYLKKLGI